jgi:hypothetical protein
MAARVSDRGAGRARTSSPGTTERTINLTHIYHSLRPLYPRDYLCLFDSLALIEFLSYWEIFPNWVFGVLIDPFKAHCWVQDGKLVLADTVTFSSRWFTPIMII